MAIDKATTPDVETLGELVEAAPDMAGMEEEEVKWQPIETAPRDGTTVMLFFPDGYWADDRNVAIGFWNGDWFGGEADSHSMTAFGSKPSHWMPLPDPPTATIPVYRATDD